MNGASFWDRPDEANKTLKTIKTLKDILNPWTTCQKSVQDTLEMFEMAEMEGEHELIKEICANSKKLIEEVESLEVKSLLSGQYDHCDIYFDINAGAGGTESCDWAHMLYRMYDRFFARNGFKTTTLEVLPGEGAGIKSISLKVEGSFAYGYLKSEIGVHRLVRISPFDANKRRHTSFVSVDVMPDMGEDVEIEILDKDLRIDTYRASGAGGQHVNKTDSAVRITHLPTNLVVQCQTERSQLQNKESCIKMLKAKLWQYAEMKRQETLASISGVKSSISWGSQIRSYVLQPYQMIKDHRTDHEVGNVDAVLDGEIFSFLKKYLQWSVKSNEQKS